MDFTNSELPCKTCKYNPKRDITEVVGGLAIDINAAIRNHAVEDTGVEVHYNQIDDHTKVIGRMRDEFDAFDVARTVERHRRNSSPSPAAAPAAAPAASAAAASGAAANPSAGSAAAPSGGGTPSA